MLPYLNQGFPNSCVPLCQVVYKLPTVRLVLCCAVVPTGPFSLLCCFLRWLDQFVLCDGWELGSPADETGWQGLKSLEENAGAVSILGEREGQMSGKKWRLVETRKPRPWVWEGCTFAPVPIFLGGSPSPVSPFCVTLQCRPWESHPHHQSPGEWESGLCGPDWVSQRFLPKQSL